jgi:hypothetical protein
MTWRSMNGSTPAAAVRAVSAEALEWAALSLLALEAIGAESAGAPVDRGQAHEEIRQAIALVRSAMERLGGQPQGGAAGYLAYGVVVRRRSL